MSQTYTYPNVVSKSKNNCNKKHRSDDSSEAPHSIALAFCKSLRKMKRTTGNKVIKLYPNAAKSTEAQPHQQEWRIFLVLNLLLWCFWRKGLLEWLPFSLFLKGSSGWGLALTGCQWATHAADGSEAEMSLEEAAEDGAEPLRAPGPLEERAAPSLGAPGSQLCQHNQRGPGWGLAPWNLTVEVLTCLQSLWDPPLEHRWVISFRETEMMPGNFGD